MHEVGGKAFCFEGYTLDLRRGCLRREDREVELRPKSFEVLRYLVENAGRLVSKDELIRAVWPNVVVTDESLTRCVSDIRVALRDSDQRIIKTVTRRGYLFAMPLSQTKGVDPTTPDIKADVDPSPRLSILVLPFANLSDDREEEYFADGLTDDLIGDLSRWTNSFVIARSTAFTFKGKAVDVKSIGRDLRVRYVLQGSVRRSNGRIRIGVQLTDTETGGHLWADRFDREFADLLEMQDEITGRIAVALHYTMTDVEVRRARDQRSNNLDARYLEARGDAARHKQSSKTTIAEGRAFYERALKIDNRSFKAWSGLAVTHAADVLARWSEAPTQQLRNAEEAAARALECNPMSPDAHFARATVLFAQGKLEMALQEYASVIELGRAWPMAYARMGILNALLGRPEETRRFVEKAIRLSPRDSDLGEWYLHIGTASFMMDKLDDAILWLQRSTEANRELGINFYVLAAACGLDGRQEEARAALSRYGRLHPGATIRKLRASPYSNHPVLLAWLERLYEGLRKAGMPEE